MIPAALKGSAVKSFNNKFLKKLEQSYMANTNHASNPGILQYQNHNGNLKL